MRSPLRYPGGKTRARSIIVPELLRQGCSTLISPFFGGGSVELAFLEQKKGSRVMGYDLYEPLVSFWSHLMTNPQGLSTLVKMHFPCERDTFYSLQSNLGEMSGIEQAAAFYVVNRCSFSGATNSGGMSPGHPRFTQSSIDRINQFRAKNLSVSCLDSIEMLEVLASESPEGKVIYLDPPYDLKNPRLYGDNGSTHVGFNHQRLCAAFRVLDGLGWNMIMSYSLTGSIVELYEGFDIRPASWSYCMRQGNSGEVLIKSRGWK